MHMSTTTVLYNSRASNYFVDEFDPLWVPETPVSWRREGVHTERKLHR